LIAGLLLFLVLPLVMGGTVYALRRWATLSALLSVGMSVALGLMILVLPLGRTIEIWGRQIVMGGTLSFLGRELILEDVDRVAMAFLYLTASGTFLLAWQTSPGSLLFPVGFGVLSLFSGSLLIRPLIYAVLLFEIAVAISVFGLQAEGGRPGKGALQYLSFSLLGMPGLLVIHWLMDRYALTPDNTGLRDTAAGLFALSFMLLMGGTPFHWWMPAVADDGEPMAGAFAFSVNHAAVWFLLLGFLETYPDIAAYGRFGPLVAGVGLAMIGVGGVLAAAQRRPGRILGYAVLADSGAALVALGLSSEAGLALALLCILSRPFGVLLMAAGIRGLKDRRRDLGWRAGSARGLVTEAPWSTLAFLIGGLSIAGLPITAGFAARWSLYRGLGRAGLVAVLLMMAASLGVMIGVWRVLSLVMAEWEPEDVKRGELGRVEREGWARGTVVLVGVVACVVVGLVPQVLAPTASRLAGLYTFLVR